MEPEQFDSPQKLDKGQRIAVGLLLCITVLLIVVSAVQFRSSLFSYGKRVKVDDTTSLDPQKRAQNEIETLKKTDTDSDGVSDYDELTVYRSSPYVRDTDSDGVLDGEEIRRGTSPTCPEGTDCLFNPLAGGAQTTTSTDTGAVPAGGETQDPLASLGAETEGSVGINITQIREALVINGVPQAEVEALSDEEILKLIEEAQEGDNNAPASGE